MYEELVKSLREEAEPCEKSGCVQTANEIRQAADSIEELNGYLAEAERDRDEYRERLDKTNDMVEKRWIPVTERLPKGEADRYLVAADFMAEGLRVSICYYADNLEEVDEYDFNGEKHGGFYGYDGEYGYYEKIGVRYWMPLPEPPKYATNQER